MAKVHSPRHRGNGDRAEVKGGLYAACRQGTLQLAPKVCCRGLRARGVSTFAMHDPARVKARRLAVCAVQPCIRGWERCDRVRGRHGKQSKVEPGGEATGTAPHRVALLARNSDEKKKLMPQKGLHERKQKQKDETR